jgi:hypothetical protein
MKKRYGDYIGENYNEEYIKREEEWEVYLGVDWSILFIEKYMMDNIDLCYGNRGGRYI